MSQDNIQDNNVDASIEITPEMQAFYQRADAIIGVANSQLGPEAHSGQVGASLLYAAARQSLLSALSKAMTSLKKKMISSSFMLNNIVKC